MASVNKVILVGNCGRDPEIRYLPSGQAVANVSVATSSRRKDKNTGETVEDTQWHTVVIWGKLAGIAEKYLKKGNEVAVEGKLVHRIYETNGGEKRFITEVNVNDMVLLGSKKE